MVSICHSQPSDQEIVSVLHNVLNHSTPPSQLSPSCRSISLPIFRTFLQLDQTSPTDEAIRLYSTLFSFTSSARSYSTPGVVPSYAEVITARRKKMEMSSMNTYLRTTPRGEGKRLWIRASHPVVLCQNFLSGVSFTSSSCLGNDN